MEFSPTFTTTFSRARSGDDDGVDFVVLSEGLEEDEHRITALSEAGMLVLEESRLQELAAELRELHPHDKPIRAQPLGVAFSGGGVRAAAFHCGCLWSLADAGLMKDVVHLSATSGGAFTTCSLISHIFQMSSEAEKALSLDSWYRQVVARTILRMQHNISFLIESNTNRFFRFPNDKLPEEVGTGLAPRIFDIPIIVCGTIVILLASPLMLVIHTVPAVVLFLETQHAHALRNAWCDPSDVSDPHSLLTNWFMQQRFALAVWVLVAIAINLLAQHCGGLQKMHPTRHLICRSVSQLVNRGFLIFGVYTLVVLAVLWLQVYEWGSAHSESSPVELAWVRHLCYRYAEDARTSEAVSRGMVCSDAVKNPVWYEYGALANYQNATWVAHYATLPAGVHGNPGEPFPFGPSSYLAAGMTSLGFSGVVLLGAAACILSWTLLQVIVTLVGPLLYLYLIAIVSKWKVYGPITGQRLLPVSISAYEPELARYFFVSCAALAILTLPFYDTVMKLSHLYYRRALKQAFFHGGKDVSSGAIASSPYCPNLLLGACVHDYRPLGEEPVVRGMNLYDFTISTFFFGSRRTGYFYASSQRRLAHMLTVAGAAPDAMLFVLYDVFVVRIFTAILSLRLGDFLRLHPEGETAVRVSQKIRTSAERLGNAFRKRSKQKMSRLKRYFLEDHDQHWMQRWLQGLLDRLPAAVPFFLCHSFLLAGLLLEGGSTLQCHWWAGLVEGACYGFIAIIAASFFGFLRPLKWLMRSPMIQQIQMVAMHGYKAPKPPPYVYICDGGLLDTLALLPLIRRRLPVIFISDAAEDPHLTMRCLREAAALLKQERLGSLFDPRDPERDFEFVLQDASRGDQAFLHLGVRYEVREGSFGVERGDIYYLRMRCPPGDQAPVRTPLTEAELLGPPRPAASAPAPGKKFRRDLGGTCAPECECGGALAGRRFPDFGVSNQCLTSLHFANLCGLAAELCEPVVRELKARLAPGE